jgi:hypothetical protein
MDARATRLEPVRLPHSLGRGVLGIEAVVFDAVCADPLYRVLCKAQKSFRARLTPKAWRCGFSAPPVRWPFADAAAESRFAEWERAYETACRGWATFHYVRGIGSGRVSDTVRPLVELHDRMSLAESGLPLA